MQCWPTKEWENIGFSAAVSKRAGKPARKGVARMENEHVRASVESALDLIGMTSHDRLEVKIAEGDPFIVIRDALKDYRPALLAMGTHARSTIGTALIGSLARDMLAEAPCDVLVAQP
jgi:nucleotide-binding universal stress UspA family protein